MRGGDAGITTLKTTVISAGAACLLPGEACLTACSRGWVQHCGMTLLLNVCLCSYQIQRCSVCTGKRSGENRVDCIGKLAPVDTAVLFYAHVEGETEDFVLNPSGDREQVQ